MLMSTLAMAKIACFGYALVMSNIENSPQYPFSDTANERKANIIWFTVDQMRGQALSIMGDPNVQTPNIDRMSRDGTHFRNAISGYPLCCPARSCWMTGQYAHRAIPGHEYALNPDIPTVADAFNAAGYHTAWLGKWHLDGFHERKGEQLGIIFRVSAVVDLRHGSAMRIIIFNTTAGSMVTMVTKTYPCTVCLVMSQKSSRIC